jgi:Tol biopolymer transport system component
MGWSPDGKSLLFKRGSALWALPFDNGKSQGSPALLRPDFGAASLGITSSGALYAVKQIIDYQVRVASIDWNSGKFVSAPTSQQEPPGAVGLLPSWSPDGKLLAYGYNNGFIKIRSIETGESRELRPGMQYFNTPRWSPDGRSFLAAGRDLKGRSGVYQIDAHSGAASLLIAGSINLQDPDGNAVPVWSPDGKFIYFRRMDKILERDLASGKDREVFRGGQGEIKVSPDGRYVAALSGLNAEGKTCSTLLLIPVAAGDAKELLRLSRPEGIPFLWSVEWTPDSSVVLVIKDTGQRRELWQVPIAGSQPRKLDIDLSDWANPASGFSIHPDGRQIAFTAGRNVPEIWALENFLPAAKPSKASK